MICGAGRTEESLLGGRGEEQQNFLREESIMMDPVCGVPVDERSQFHTQFAGKKYFFCSEDCRKEFEAEPDEYVETAAA